MDLFLIFIERFQRKSEQYKNALQVANSANLWSNTQNFLVNKKVKK